VIGFANRLSNAIAAVAAGPQVDFGIRPGSLPMVNGTQHRLTSIRKATFAGHDNDVARGTWRRRCVQTLARKVQCSVLFYLKIITNSLLNTQNEFVI
jgi:hypothetical protein